MVDFVEALGADTLVHGHLGSARANLTIRLPGSTRVASGDSVPLVVPPERLHLFDANIRRADLGRSSAWIDVGTVRVGPSLSGQVDARRGHGRGRAALDRPRRRPPIRVLPRRRQDTLSVADRSRGSRPRPLCAALCRPDQSERFGRAGPDARRRRARRDVGGAAGAPQRRGRGGGPPAAGRPWHVRQRVPCR